MSAVNYARHDSLSRYVFLAPGERPRPEWLTGDWAWWREPPGELARVIGYLPGPECKRTGHALRLCSTCSSGLTGRREARRAVP